MAQGSLLKLFECLLDLWRMRFAPSPPRKGMTDEEALAEDWQAVWNDWQAVWRDFPAVENTREGAVGPSSAPKEKEH